ISIPQVVTPSYARAYHAALLWGSLQHLPCPSFPRCVPCSVPGHLLRPMPASGFCVPVPVTSGRTGAAGGGKFKKFKKCLFFFFFNLKYALSCALPAFCLFFL
ncbi:unnamed protein product, partial [Staurois parvus]